MHDPLRRDAALVAREVGFDAGLDLLAAQQQPDRSRKLDYKAYLASFESDDRWFYRREGNIGLGERLTAAWQAFRRPRK